MRICASAYFTGSRELAEAGALGELCCVRASPRDVNLLLLAYSGGSVVLWNLKQRQSVSLFNAAPAAAASGAGGGPGKALGSLRWVSWHSSGLYFAATFSKGVVQLWKTSRAAEPFDVIHGAMRCSGGVEYRTLFLLGRYANRIVLSYTSHYSMGYCCMC